MPPFDAGVPALVLRLDRNPFHHGTLGAVRSLGRAGVEVHAVVESARSPVARSRHLRRVHPAPRWAAADAAPDPDAFVDLLLAVSERIGRPAVLVPMDDLGAVLTAARAPQLAERYLFPALPPALPGLLADKGELAAVCRAAGVAHPETVVPADAAATADAVVRLGLPLVAKWSRPWLLPPAAGLRSTCLVRSPAEARALYERGAGTGAGLLLQRFLPDAPDGDWFFHGYVDAHAVCLAGGSGRKELSWPPRTGLTAKGRWQPNAAVEAAALRLVAHVGYRGVIDLDFRCDPSTGAYSLLDANPRPGAQFRLFTGADGTDVVRALYLDLTGQPVPARAERPGRVFVAENYALLATAAGGRRRAARAPRGAGVETAWYAADDPLPFLAMAGAWLGRGLAKGAGRTASALRDPRIPLPRTAATAATTEPQHTQH
ncbi:ATP-grasp domain-containing protein [Streptomyces sp. NPDC048057]|uniref:carboxylate--amine ligase n=1 Tax=Streptomyces sp. NPDC048057 TaxID=3155628 RepID=UPI0033E275E1